MKLVNRAINVHLGSDLKTRWITYCKQRHQSPGVVLKELVAAQLALKEHTLSKPFKALPESFSQEPKVRFEILLTPSEKRALRARADSEQCSMRRWVVDACRARLTNTFQPSMKELEILGESNYQLLAIGRNLNQIAKHLNQGYALRITSEQIKKLKHRLNQHIDCVNNTMRASVERWDIE